MSVGEYRHCATPLMQANWLRRPQRQQGHYRALLQFLCRVQSGCELPSSQLKTWSPSRRARPEARQKGALRKVEYQFMKKILIIGIGAGDPDYVTMQAVNALNEVDVFFIMDKGP